MSLDVAALQKETGDAWQLLTGLDALPADGPMPEDAVTFRTSVVAVTGAWAAEVCVHCPSELATLVASAMFMMEPAETTEAEVEDALGELANVIAGGIQARVPGPTDLTVPVHRGPAASLDAIAEGNDQWRIDLSCSGHPVIITVTRMELP